MCGTYFLEEADKLAQRFHVEDKDWESKLLQPNFNVKPSQIMPVITEDEKGRHLEFMRWGIPRIIKKDAPEKELINTRAESAFKPFWSTYLKTRRILIPANGYVEWKDLGKGVPKQPYLFRPKDEHLFAFAGIWGTWKDENQKEWKVYSIMTTEPNKEAATVHNRMPVILHQEDEAAWLEPSHNNDRGVIETLLRPYEDNGIEMAETSRDVNNARNNYKELIYPFTA